MYFYLAYALGRTLSSQSDLISVCVCQKIPLHGKRLFGTNSSTFISLDCIVILTSCVCDRICDFGTLCHFPGTGMCMTAKWNAQSLVDSILYPIILLVFLLCGKSVCRSGQWTKYPKNSPHNVPNTYFFQTEAWILALLYLHGYAGCQIPGKVMKIQSNATSTAIIDSGIALGRRRNWSYQETSICLNCDSPKSS